MPKPQTYKKFLKKKGGGGRGGDSQSNQQSRQKFRFSSLIFDISTTVSLLQLHSTYRWRVTRRIKFNDIHWLRQLQLSGSHYLCDVDRGNGASTQQIFARHFPRPQKTKFTKEKKQALNFRWDAKENFTARVETTERRETLTSRIRY